MLLQLFIGPAIVAALVSAVVTAGGWYVQWRLSTRLEINRRKERVTDVQTALLAEIRSAAHHLSQYDNAKIIVDVKRRIEGSAGAYRPFVPKESSSPVFSAVVKEISVLPTEVIDAVVLFYTQQEAIANFADDLRSERFLALEQDQMIAMLNDYLVMKDHARKLSAAAMRELETSLGFNTPVADP